MNRVTNRSSLSLDLRIYLLLVGANLVKNASSLLLFSGHSELETGLQCIS